MLIGGDTDVSCVDGRLRRYVNLDYAASAPALADVWAAVAEFMPVVPKAIVGSVLGFAAAIAAGKAWIAKRREQRSRDEDR